MNDDKLTNRQMQLKARYTRASAELVRAHREAKAAGAIDDSLATTIHLNASNMYNNDTTPEKRFFSLVIIEAKEVEDYYAALPPDATAEPFVEPPSWKQRLDEMSQYSIARANNVEMN